VTVLDTNVVSELMHPKPNGRVIAWLDRQAAHSLWITAITAFELLFGIALLAPGRRQAQIAGALTKVLNQDLDRRVLDFDWASAEKTAILAAERQRAGRPVDLRDTQIAGIVLAREATLATRNTRHFEDLSVPLINPWNE
jgi:toxin FitB